jgi:radical SAM protein with 4Fe4S-binding SPASM domain
MVSVIEQPDNEKEIEAIFKFWKEKVDTVLIRKMLSFKGIIKRSKNYKAYMQNTTPCPFLWERVVVDPLGNVRGCVSDINAEFVIGNIMENEMSNIWHSELIEDYRKKHLNGKIKECLLCKDCVDIQYRSWNYNYFHALDKK